MNVLRIPTPALQPIETSEGYWRSVLRRFWKDKVAVGAAADPVTVSGTHSGSTATFTIGDDGDERAVPYADVRKAVTIRWRSGVSAAMRLKFSDSTTAKVHWVEEYRRDGRLVLVCEDLNG